MAKKIAIVLFSVILLLSMAACKNNTEETDSVNETVSSTEIQSADLPDAAKSEEEATTAEETTAEETTTEKTTAETVKQTTTTTKPATSVKSTTTTKRVATTAKSTTTTKRVTTTAKSTTTTKRVTTTAKSTTTTKPNYTVNSSNSNVKSVYSLVNQQRANNGLSKLSYRNDLQSAANTRAKELAQSFSHTRPNGKSCYSVINVPYKTAAENIAWGQKTAQQVMDEWMESSGHRNNILSANYTGIAIGYYEENGLKYYVQLFVG